MELIGYGFCVILVGLFATSLAAFAADTNNPDKLIAKRAQSLASGQYAVGALGIIMGCTICAIGYSSTDQSIWQFGFSRSLWPILWRYLRLGSLFLSAALLYFGSNLLFRHQKFFADLAKTGYKIPPLDNRTRKNSIRWGTPLVVLGALGIVVYFL
jgi:hypothetical protein